MNPLNKALKSRNKALSSVAQRASIEDSIKPISQKKSTKNHLKNHNYSSSKKLVSQNKKNSKRLLIKSLMFLFAANFLFVCYFAAISFKGLLDEQRVIAESVVDSFSAELKGFLGYSEILLNSANQAIVTQKSFGADSSDILFSFEKIRNRSGLKSDLEGDGALYWVDRNKYLVASSLGKIKKPISLSSHEYIEKSQIRTGKILIGKPFFGILSDQKNIPFVVGAIGENNRHVGTSLLTVSFESFIENFKKLTKTSGGEFVILDFDKKILIESNSKFFSENKEFSKYIENLDFKSDEKSYISVLSAIKNNKNLMVKRSIADYKIAVIYSLSNQSFKDNLLSKVKFYIFEAMFSLLMLLLMIIFA